MSSAPTAASAHGGRSIAGTAVRSTRGHAPMSPHAADNSGNEAQAAPAGFGGSSPAGASATGLKGDRKSVVEGKSGTVRVDIRGCSITKKKKKQHKTNNHTN